ncbi:MAG TPA: TIGR04282 family arsenosugar biosynthesis glycosyltransferase [Abditibacteriaceae bacterium]|jgi:hypothetical protein
MPESLIVFARAPVPGQTKTRLARVLGKENAAALAAAMLRDTLRIAQAANGETCVAFSPINAFEAGPYSLGRFWDGPHFAQCEGDIGDRMLAAFRHEFGRGCRHVVLIGSDVPDLPATVLRDAFAALVSHDLVFGPAHDGGFYLIGTARALPDNFFDSVVWSSESVLQSTLSNAHRQQLTSAQLPLCRDVDEFSDLCALDRRLKNTAHAPNTQNELQRLQHVIDAVHRVEVG